MPGICGIIGKGSEASETNLDRMIASMHYERFYKSGKYINHDLGIYLGWVVLDGSYSDCMPVWNERRDTLLIFYGEEFGPEHEQGADGNGHTSNAAGPVQLYEHYGEGWLERLNGWFCGVLVDLRKREAILFNDRYGLQRVYCRESGEAGFFASEVKALLQAHPDSRAFDPQGLAEMFSFGCVLENRTLFRDVKLLPGGSAWKYSAGECRPQKRSYFSPAQWENQTSLGEQEYYEKLRRVFTGILPRYYQPHGKVALSLTGGLDTRMIAACNGIKPGQVPCYTFGGMYGDCYDLKIARKVAQVIGQNHEVLRVGTGFLRDFPKLAERTVQISEGNLDVTGATDLYVNIKAREIAPIRLTGNYGSEVLRGARHLKAVAPCEGLFEKEFEDQINNAAATLERISQGNGVSFAAFKQTPWHHYNRLSLEQSQLVLRSPFLDNELVELAYRAPLHTLRGNEMSMRLIRDGNPKLARIMTDRALGDGASRTVSSVGHAYLEFLFKAEYAYNHGMPQWLARMDHVVSGLHLERLFLGRHKFYHFRIWYRDQLSEYVKSVLLDPKAISRPYLKGKRLQQIVNAHLEGRRNYTAEISKLLTAELTQRVLFEQ